MSRRDTAAGRNGVPAGENHPQARITDAQVRDIRRRYRPWCRDNGGAALAREYGVSPSAISQIVNWETRWSA